MLLRIIFCGRNCFASMSWFCPCVGQYPPRGLDIGAGTTVTLEPYIMGAERGCQLPEAACIHAAEMAAAVRSTSAPQSCADIHQQGCVVWTVLVVGWDFLIQLKQVTLYHCTCRVQVVQCLGPGPETCSGPVGDTHCSLSSAAVPG